MAELQKIPKIQSNLKSPDRVKSKLINKAEFIVGPQGPKGDSLEFDWEGTNLGVRVEGQEEYEYQDLLGPQGNSLEFNWDKTNLGIRVEGQEEYEYQDLQGPQGEKGDDALINGVNTLTIQEGNNIELVQQDDTLIINNTYEYDDTDVKTNIQSLEELTGELDKDLSNAINDIEDLETNKADKKEIPDVSEFIKNTVDNLVNYYKKSETYTQTEVNQLIGAIKTISMKVVPTRPQTGEANIIYLVPSAKSETENIYEEWIYVDGKWELIGSTKCDLSNYYTKEQINTLLFDYITSNDLEEILNDYATKNDLPKNISELNNDCEFVNKTYVDNELELIKDNIELVDNKETATRNELERVKNDILETGEVNDSYIHLEDSTMAEYQELGVDGVSKQDTTSGKNLLDVENTIKKNGFYDSTGTFVENDRHLSLVGVKIPTGEITLSSNKSINKLIGFVSNDYSQGVVIDWQNYNTKNYNNVDDFEYFGFYFVKTEFEEKDTYIQLELGTEATQYEPYTGGRPSPNPDYEQSISVLDGSFNIKSCNKNLFILDNNLENYYRMTNNGLAVGSKNPTFLTVDFDKDGFTVKENSTYNWIGKIVELEKNKNYILRAITNRNIRIVGFNGLVGNGVSLSSSSVGNVNNRFNSGYYKYIFVSFYAYTGSTFKNIQIEENLTATPYEQHLQSQIEVNLPEGEFVGKIDDTYKDTLEVKYNEEDGNYHLMLRKMIGKKIFDGSENGWTKQSSWSSVGNKTNSFYIPRDVFSKLYIPLQGGISNYFINKDVSLTTIDVEAMLLGVENFIVRVPKSISEVSDLTSWLSTHNIEVYYVLETPYELDLGVVDMPITYDGTTHLFTDSDLLPTINATYYRNFHQTIKNLQDNKADKTSLNNYVLKTQKATSTELGLIKVSSAYGTAMRSNGELIGYTRTYGQYDQDYNETIITKGTLEKVITGKELADKNYVDEKIGDIDTVLTSIDTGEGV